MKTTIKIIALGIFSAAIALIGYKNNNSFKEFVDSIPEKGKNATGSIVDSAIKYKNAIKSKVHQATAAD